MRVTQDQAKHMHCCGPQGCGRFDDATGYVAGQNRRYCIGSKCMAWRWEVRERPLAPEKRQGYCGLAGTSND
jgi:hypothetical protein